MTGWGGNGGTAVGLGGSDYGRPVVGSKPQKPPFAKGGLEGLTHILILIPTSMPTPTPRPEPPPAQCSARNGLGGRGIAGDAAWCNSSARGNPSNPPFAKGGLLGGLRRRPTLRHHSASIHRHSRRPHRHSRPVPSFPRKRESTPRPIVTPGITGVLDSGLRRNDGGGVRFAGRWRRGTTLPHPTLSRWERAFRGLRRRPALHPHSVRPSGPHRHSGAGRNPEPR